MQLGRRSLIIGSVVVLIATAGAAPVAAGNGLGVDITATAAGKSTIKEAVSSFNAQGSPAATSDFTATSLADGSVLVVRKGFTVTHTADGFRTVTSGAIDAPKTGTATGLVAANATWTLLGQQCFGALFRGAAHMDTCYNRYKMASDGDAGKDYWRLDLFATMFAEGRTLDWGWVTGDRDAGPALNFVDWAPDSDVDQACAAFGLSITVVGVGAGFSSTFCELNNISKSAGPVVGWFKDYWDWGTKWVPTRDRDRKVAIEIGASSTQGGGTPTWGLSWNFAAH